jgi:hypothetical protein
MFSVGSTDVQRLQMQRSAANKTEAINESAAALFAQRGGA